MLRPLWKMLGRHALCGTALLTVANLVQAQAPVTYAPPRPMLPEMPAAMTQPGPSLQGPVSKVSATAAPVQSQLSSDDLKARVDRLEKMNQELMEALKNGQTRAVPTSTSNEAAQPGANPNALSPQDVRQLVDGYLAEKEQLQKLEAKAKKEDGYKVGTDLRMTASWQNGVVFETPNKDFWMRSGFRFQWDNVFFHQGDALRKAAPTGVGVFQDGDYFRRVRPNFSGGFWEVGEFNVEIKLETVQNGIVGMDDVWVGVKDIPFIGTVRGGHFHLAHGLEADMYSSSKPMTFFEVYSGNNAFFSGERTGSGLWLTNAYMDQRITYAAMGYRPENAGNGDDFSNGDYGGIFRMTGLPIYQNDGRCLLHLGGSATYRHARRNQTGALTGLGTVNFQTTPELLDFAGGDNGYGFGTSNSPATQTVTSTSTSKTALKGAGKATATTTTTTTSTQTLNGFANAPGNRANLVSTGAIIANASTIYAAEMLYINGPFSLQAEYDWAFMDDAIIGGKNQGNLGYTGGYLMASYFLTGENRTYDKRFGKLGGEYITRANTPFWLVRDGNHNFNWGLGAWELAARYSHIDLNTGTGTGGLPLVNGGILDQVELGVNWHLNNNLRVQFMYLDALRYGFYGANPAQSGWMSGFGIRTQLTF